MGRIGEQSQPQERTAHTAGYSATSTEPLPDGGKARSSSGQAHRGSLLGPGRGGHSSASRVTVLARALGGGPLDCWATACPQLTLSRPGTPVQLVPDLMSLSEDGPREALEKVEPRPGSTGRHHCPRCWGPLRPLPVTRPPSGSADYTPALDTHGRSHSRRRGEPRPCAQTPTASSRRAERTPRPESRPRPRSHTPGVPTAAGQSTEQTRHDGDPPGHAEPTSLSQGQPTPSPARCRKGLGGPGRPPGPCTGPGPRSGRAAGSGSRHPRSPGAAGTGATAWQRVCISVPRDPMPPRPSHERTALPCSHAGDAAAGVQVVREPGCCPTQGLPRRARDNLLKRKCHPVELPATNKGRALRP